MSRDEYARFLIRCLFIGVVIGTIYSGNWSAVVALIFGCGCGILHERIEYLLK